MTAREQLSFGARLRALREAARLSQEELAGRAGISSHAVSALERGTRTRPYPHTVRALTEALAASDDDRAALVASIPPRRRDPLPVASDSGSPSAPRSLPEPATPLLGRDHETAALLAQLRDPARRLVTLTGVGGVGKTRLSLVVAAAAAPEFVDGVAFVELAPVLAVDRVLPAVLDAVAAGNAEDRDPAAAVVEALQDRQILLVLDNLEHLLEAAPQIAALIEAVPGLTVLATSRAPLRVRGETEFPVQPLGLPAGDGTGDHPGLTDSPAVRLFLDRAGAVSPGWGRAPADATPVAAICVRLAGIPLALELAAARARLLDPATLLARLDDAAPAGSRDLPARQHTMSATLDWSYGLLLPPEQMLLRLLSVFAGGFRLEDLEAVVERAGAAERDEVLLLLQALSEHSLVQRHAERPGRHRLLEPVAQYAWQRLEEAGERPTATRAHAEHFLALAEAAAPQYQRGEQVVWLARIDAEHPNLTVAGERSLADGRAGSAARLGWALWIYWWLRGYPAHGRRFTEAVLAHDLPHDLRPRAELAAATMAFAMDDIAASEHWWRAAETHSRVGSDLVAQANAVAGLGLARLAAGDLAGAEEQFLEAAGLAEAAGDGGEWTGALNQIWLGTIALAGGDPDRAVAHIERGRASARRRGDRLTGYVALFNLAQVETARKRHDLARGHLEDGMRMSMETGDHANLAYFLDALATVEAADGRLARVPILAGAAQGIWESLGARGYGYYRLDPAVAAQTAAAARARLGDDRYDDALDHGRGLSPAEAVALALGRPAQ